MRDRSSSNDEAVPPAFATGQSMSLCLAAVPTRSHLLLRLVASRSRKLTADEIKAKYGRKKEKSAKQSDVDGAAAQMAQNKDKLLERGEKLNRMQEKLDAMNQARAPAGRCG